MCGTCQHGHIWYTYHEIFLTWTAVNFVLGKNAGWYFKIQFNNLNCNHIALFIWSIGWNNLNHYLANIYTRFQTFDWTSANIFYRNLNRNTTVSFINRISMLHLPNHPHINVSKHRLRNVVFWGMLYINAVDFIIRSVYPNTEHVLQKEDIFVECAKLRIVLNWNAFGRYKSLPVTPGTPFLTKFTQGHD